MQPTLFPTCRNCGRFPVPAFGSFCDACDRTKRARCLRAIAARAELASRRLPRHSNRGQAAAFGAAAVRAMADNFAHNAAALAQCAAHYALLRLTRAPEPWEQARAAVIAQAREAARVMHDLAYIGSADYQRDMED